MAELSTAELAIARLKENESRFDTFVNTDDNYTTNETTPRSVESLPHFIQRMLTQYLTLDIQGAWQTTTAYVKQDIVTESGTVYICLEDHTSGTFSTDLASNKWTVYQGLTALTGISFAADYTDLRNYASPADGQMVYVIADGIAGLFKFVASETAADNGGTIIENGSGAFVRQFTGPAMIEWWEADTSGATSSTAAFDAAGLYYKNLSCFNDSTFLLSTTVDWTSDTIGDGLQFNFPKSATFKGPDTSTNVFDITGQRNFSFTGGTYKKGQYIFYQSGDDTVAYGSFNDMDFYGDSGSQIIGAVSTDTNIGASFNRCQFGIDLVSDSIDNGVIFTGSSSTETNVIQFNDCVFIEVQEYCVKIQDSANKKANISFTGCWFEDSLRAVYAGSNSRLVTFDDCYFENLGSASAYPLEFSSSSSYSITNCTFNITNDAVVALVNVSGSFGQMDNNDVTLDNGGAGATSFVRFASLGNINTLTKTKMIDNGGGNPAYTTALFKVAASTDTPFVAYDIFPKAGSLTGDDIPTQKTQVGRRSGTQYHEHQCTGVTISTTNTWTTVATLSANGQTTSCRIEVYLDQSLAGVGSRWVEHFTKINFSGGAATTEDTSSKNSTSGAEWAVQVIDSSGDAIVQVKWTSGSGSATSVAPLVIVKQGEAQSTKRITIS